MNLFLLAGTSALASSVEAVEAVTIVLAVGFTQGWKAALTGALWALVALLGIVGILGSALLRYVPLATLQTVIGLFLVLFGYTWLRKAIWRYAGRKALHDEEAIFEKEVAHLREVRSSRVAMATAFNAVLLEGLEIAVIVITFGAASSAGLIAAASGAVAAAVVVIAAGVILRKPFSRVPENLMKFVVGIMLVSLGTFWSGEGLGVNWVFGDTTLLAIILLYVLTALELVRMLKRTAPAP
ncbi:MAG: hypothetical protein DLM50_01405 [Candidatus Meridianibacter frigidus]|nr:MAG: hypothetical protein DLM50_01405 [Candidatus Eremiobacteraeota bacterium]